MRLKIKHLNETCLGSIITIFGWIRSVRSQKHFSFVEINDGSKLGNLQVIVDPSLAEVDILTTGTSVKVTGKLVASMGGKQAIELQATDVAILGTCPTESYPLQKKRHSFEFLRTIAHLRARTNTQGAVLRVRSALSHATHRFFQENDFLYIHTPIISAADTEGAGEQFLVTTLPIDAKQKQIDFANDFFAKKAFLTVSGQLNAETIACAMSDVYTFGPTFRAENSNSSRHLAEFWMIEPEMAFCDLQGNLELAQKYVKAMIKALLGVCHEEVCFFEEFIEKGLTQRLDNALSTPFAHMSYTQAIEILKKAPVSFVFPVEWGMDLQSEHERYLAEEHCKCPVFLTDYPKEIKAFYMRANPDGKTVAAMDLLVPKIGELIGGSQREERHDTLRQKMIDFGLDVQTYWWYLELRTYGTVPHAGFGVGFERLIQFVTGMENIRDVIPFPRYPGHADF